MSETYTGEDHDLITTMMHILEKVEGAQIGNHSEWLPDHVCELMELEWCDSCLRWGIDFPPEGDGYCGECASTPMTDPSAAYKATLEDGT